MRLRRLAWSAVIATSLVPIAREANAQETGFAVNRFEPAERGSTWFALESLDLRGSSRPAFGIVGDYQYRPLAIYDRSGDVRSSVVGHMMTTHVGAAWTLGDRFRLALSMPFVLYTEGEQGRLQGRTYNRPANEQALGDLRVGVDLRLFGEYDSPITLAIGVQGWAPTGDTQSYTSDGRARVQPRLLAAGQLGSFVYAAKTGVMIRDPEAGSFAGGAVGSELTYGLAAGLRVADNRLTIGPEVFGSTVITDQTFKTRTTPVELIFGTHYVFEGGFRIGAGVGPGLTRGFGSPAVRALLSLEYMADVVTDRDGDGILDKDDACPDTQGVASPDPAKNGCPPPPPPPDRDGDGILDADDACPDVPGKPTDDKRTNGCADKDGDGILDPLDACVDVPGIPSDDPKLNGCPDPDTDKDGILDKEDACPKEPGVRTTDPKTNGCPDPDRDKDGINNDVDACPDDPGKPDPDPKKNGCPKAFVSQGQIKIIDQVKFKTGSAQILPGKDSEEVLQAVLKVLKEHPEIKKVRVEGHTDDRGAAAMNRKLSKDRAQSVVTWLLKNGIEKDRLHSEGFGPDRPIDSNTSDTGRQNNRRVEFHIEPADKPQDTPGQSK
jgi:outer membrane protein OmpA-like peptidoglycan-associated protein